MFKLKMFKNVQIMFAYVQLCSYICCVQNKYIKIMTTSTTYDPETKIATVSENGYEVASNDYNSLNGFECELGMTEEKKQEFSLKMDNEKNLWDEFAEDNYDVASEQTQR